MRPWIFQGDLPLIGGIAIPGYYFWLTVAFIFTTNIIVRESRRSGIPIRIALDCVLIVLVGALVGARLGHVVFEDPMRYLNDPFRLLQVWKGGFVFYGGVIFCNVCMYIYLRWRHVDYWMVGDIFGPATALALGVGRLACFSAGCCYGKPIDFPLGRPLPWGVTFYSGAVPEVLEGIPLHPTQLYLCANGLVAFLYANWIRRRQTYRGQVFMHMLVAYATGRAIVEIFRFDLERGVYFGWLSTSMLIGAAIVSCALIGMRLLKRRDQKAGLIPEA